MKNRIYFLLVLAAIAVGCTSQKNLKESFSPIWNEQSFEQTEQQGWRISFDSSFHVDPEFTKVKSSIVPWGPYITWNRSFEQTFSKNLYADTLEQLTLQFFENPENRAHLYFKSFNIHVKSGPTKVLIQDQGKWFFGTQSNPVILPQSSPLTVVVSSEKWEKTYSVPVQLKALRKREMSTEEWSAEYRARERWYMGVLFAKFLTQFEQDLQKY